MKDLCSYMVKNARKNDYMAIESVRRLQKYFIVYPIKKNLIYHKHYVWIYFTLGRLNLNLN